MTPYHAAVVSAAYSAGSRRYRYAASYDSVSLSPRTGSTANSSPAVLNRQTAAEVKPWRPRMAVNVPPSIGSTPSLVNDSSPVGRLAPPSRLNRMVSIGPVSRCHTRHLSMAIASPCPTSSPASNDS